MKIPCVQITRELKRALSQRIIKLKKKKITPKLVTFLVGQASDQLSFVAIKQKMARSLGIKFELVHLKETPPFETFANLLRKKAYDRQTTGVIIQQPLPSRLITETLYNFIPRDKELEGHHPKAPFLPPLGLAVLTVLKHAYQPKVSLRNLFIEEKQDSTFFKNALKHKKIVVVGRGLTGGQAIGKTLSYFRINYLNTNSQTDNPRQYFEEADVIITATGKKVITSDMLKPGVILINVGFRKEGKKIKGDYDEADVKSIASYYTETPNGVGPIDVLYLYKNLIDATEMQR